MISRRKSVVEALKPGDLAALNTEAEQSSAIKQELDVEVDTIVRTTKKEVESIIGR